MTALLPESGSRCEDAASRPRHPPGGSLTEPTAHPSELSQAPLAPLTRPTPLSSRHEPGSRNRHADRLCLAFYRGWQIHSGHYAWLAYGLGVPGPRPRSLALHPEATRAPRLNPPTAAPRNKIVLFLVRSPEAADAQVKNTTMMTADARNVRWSGPVHPAGSRPPQNRREHQHRQQKENPGNLKPDLAADTAEGLEEIRPGRAPRRAWSACDATPGGGIRVRRARLCLRSCRIALLAFAHDGLARKAPRHSHAHAQHPADGLRSHFDMMVAAADRTRTARIQSECQLPDGRLRSKV